MEEGDWTISSKMGDHVELTLQITPETPGRPSIRNPFESPNDYHHLREPLVPSPSVFKSKPCKATPPKFNWSIDEMSSLLPVHIDPEDIQRQSFYLSQTRMDSDIEEKRQNAIEQFFTKGAIVPSPWAAPDTRKGPPVYMKSSKSAMIVEEPEKLSVSCQTTLSLPLAFDLEKVLGDYYRYDEACDAVQESLSSSSLRRKLFLDGQGAYSGSDSSSPPSPERSHIAEERLSLNRAEVAGSEGEATSSIFSSPLSCGTSAPTLSTGQFSSSPIQHGCFRDCSLGSLTSPLFPDRSSPAGLASPTISPIVANAARTPICSAERKQPSNFTPLGVPLDKNVTPCNESPFVEGCSPIRSSSPQVLHCHNESQHNARPKPRPRVRCWASPPLISPILNPKLQDNQEAEHQLPFSSPSSCSSSSLPPMELDPPSPLGRDAHLADTERVSLDHMEPVKMEEGKEVETEERKMLEEEEEEGAGLSGLLTSSRMGNVSAIESSRMFVSLLAEASSIRYDSSMQVDSGYNTTSAGTASLIDGLGSDCHGKESFTSNLAEDAFQLTRHTKVKGFYPHH